MSSTNYSILEIFCPARQETLHITSLYLRSLEEGDTEILPLHKTIDLTLPNQILLIKKEGNEEKVFGLNITDGILNITHPQPNRTLINISVYDFEWADALDGKILNQFQQAVLNQGEIIAKSNQIIQSELVPRYNTQTQELRNVEQDIKIEFEQSLKS